MTINLWWLIIVVLLMVFLVDYVIIRLISEADSKREDSKHSNNKSPGSNDQ